MRSAAYTEFLLTIIALGVFALVGLRVAELAGAFPAPTVERKLPELTSLDGTDAAFSRTEKMALQKAFRVSIYDPSSLELVELRRGGMPNHVCGRMNGRNAWGGYIGFKQFYIDVESGEVSVEPGETKDFSKSKSENDLSTLLTRQSFLRIFNVICNPDEPEKPGPAPR